MNPTTPHPKCGGNRLIRKPLGSVAIATKVPLVAIQKQIQSKRGHVPCAVARSVAGEDKR